MRDELLKHVNEILHGKRRNGGKARKTHRAEASQAHLEAYLLRYFLTALQKKGYFTNENDDVNALKAALMGHSRFEEISAACQWSEKIIDDLHTDFNRRAPLLIFLGQLLGIDETINAYFGKDAQDAKVSRYIPPKPHNFGLLGYRGAVRLRHSGARVTVALVSVTPEKKWTPSAAALKIIDLVRQNQSGSAHYVLDSAFATTDLLAYTEANDAFVSVSLKANRTAGYGALYSLATEGLGAGDVRTYTVGRYFLQARRKENPAEKGGTPLHAVLSSAWRMSASAIEPVKRLGEYETAVSLWQREKAATLTALLDTHMIGSPRDIILAKTGWDVLAPPPNEDGRILWTKEALMKMSLPQLKELTSITRGCRAPGQRAKDLLVDDILRHHPRSGDGAALVAKKSGTPQNLANLRDLIGRDTSNKSPILDLYNAEYGVVDEINQDIYRYILHSTHRNWAKLMGFTVLHAMYMNAWACFSEARAEARGRDRLGARIPGAAERRCGFDQFILNAARQFVAEKQQ
jgi:hypothetical protein